MTIRASLLRLMVVAPLVAGTVGCNDGLTDLNRNPNEPVEVGAEFLFPNATEAAVTRAFGSGLHMDITALWVQHYAETRYTEEDRYELSDGAVSGHWSGFYAGPLQDFQEVIMEGERLERPNVVAMGRIMRAWTFHIVTDLWGDVGYSEALRGRDRTAGSTVAFDPQQQVYTGMLAELESAAAALTPGSPTFGQADLIYRSDLARWRKFANSLRLRLAMRLSEASAATAQAEFRDALAAGVFAANSDNAVFNYVANGVDVHPLFAYQRSRDDHAISATMVDTLLSLSDPRVEIYADPNRAGNYKGMENGSMADPPLDSISRIGTYFTRADAPAVLMSYAEVLLLRAEAAERGWTDEDAGALYRDAIRASMQQLGIADNRIAEYLAQARVQYSGGQEGLRQIGLQKWIVLYGNGPEAYSEWRRTGYPQLVAGPDALNDGRIPLRLPYPSSEGRLNAVNLQQAIGRQDGASLNDRVWWNR